MSSELRIDAIQQGGMRVLASDGALEMVMDYPLAPSQAVAGFTPLQALLASLCACSANTVRVLLERRMNVPVSGLEVHAVALRRTEHPTVLTEISLEFVIHGHAIDPEAVARAIQVSEEQLCPVWNMLKSGTPITARFRIVAD
jgi:putative redox protein